MRGNKLMKSGTIKTYDTLREETNYCVRCWREFTTLSEDERKVVAKCKERSRKYSLNNVFKKYYEE